ncbi:sarcinarray family MAST domain-containing protein [Methanomethylovorans sp.]|uniref:sarcinarray family MAST domain-containing protein n=1 Tax=Methanomethylovorans sp. TaxID=2758717 RepID=UPI00351C7BA3
MAEKKNQKVILVYYPNGMISMNIKTILIFTMFLFVATSPLSVAKSDYVTIDLYYNNQLYPSNATPKPVVNIGEPFKVKFEITCYRKVYLSVQLTELGSDSFEIIEGPILKMDTYITRIIEPNETISYEWTLKPTESWAGGGMPLNFVYQLTDYEREITISQGEFTAAYVTISNEYYKPSYATTKPGAQSPGDTTFPALPAFTLPAALAAMYIVYVLRRQ